MIIVTFIYAIHLLTQKKIILQTKAHCIDSVVILSYLMVDKMSAIFNTYSTIQITSIS